jgi:hypothetical protein
MRNENNDAEPVANGQCCFPPTAELGARTIRVGRYRTCGRKTGFAGSVLGAPFSVLTRKTETIDEGTRKELS